MTQNSQDVLNLVCGLTGVSEPNVTTMTPVVLNGQTSPMTKTDGFYLVRVSGENFVGTIDTYLQGRPVLQMTTTDSLHTGAVYLITDSIDAIGIDDQSGAVTLEGYEYTIS